MRLATGDLVLFKERRRSAWWLLDKAIELVTRSAYVHVGMVLVDPPFSVPRGTYLWESGYEGSPNPETGTRNLGVRLTEIGAAIGDADVVVRKCTLRVADDKLRKIHRDVFMKPYDVCLSDWLLATLRVDLRPQKTDRFWCSAFVAYVLTRLGWLNTFDASRAFRWRYAPVALRRNAVQRASAVVRRASAVVTRRLRCVATRCGGTS